jgi:membrane protein
MAVAGTGQWVFYRVVTMLAVITWFTLILKFLSFGRPDWRTAVAGGVFTGLLFTIGEVLLHLVFSYNNVKTIYGTSASLVLLLLFVFYCSFIFYFGACLTQALAVRTNRPIVPARHAIRYTLKDVELGGG